MTQQQSYYWSINQTSNTTSPWGFGQTLNPFLQPTQNFFITGIWATGLNNKQLTASPVSVPCNVNIQLVPGGFWLTGMPTVPGTTTSLPSLFQSDFPVGCSMMGIELAMIQGQIYSLSFWCYGAIINPEIQGITITLRYRF